MIVKRIWVRETKYRFRQISFEVHGWFLFGFIPLYIKDVGQI